MRPSVDKDFQTYADPVLERGDILYGAEEISAFLFGDRKFRRRVYSKIAKNKLPTFRIGANVCARKSTLLEWIAKQEEQAQGSR